MPNLRGQRSSFHIRSYREADAECVARIFRDAVWMLGREKYDARQTAAWAAAADDLPSFRKRLAQGFTVVAEREGQAVAFGQLFPSDVVEMLYCDPAHARIGAGTLLLNALENQARSRGQIVLNTKSSLRARSFFNRHGYREVGKEIVTRNGVAIPRFSMRKLLPASPSCTARSSGK